MTAEQFEQEYAARSGVSVEWLRAQGRVVATCDCDEPDCEGFQSISRENLDSYREMRRTWVQVLPAEARGE